MMRCIKRKNFYQNHCWLNAIHAILGSNANDVRLVGSLTDGQGAVEMNIAGYGWVRLCPGAFDLSGVCNKLGYTSTTYQTYT